MDVDPWFPESPIWLNLAIYLNILSHIPELNIIGLRG